MVIITIMCYLVSLFTEVLSSLNVFFKETKRKIKDMFQVYSF